ncbi:hypothetical protein OBBRIDRAFT_839921 [Obba rivulosa]|uniref:Uncharacterized protein n=1 Tax=Obba rivulosa TaxID=1052685 RepID=A0A8E2DEQ6_9APHY|nr:hypothetical protein OBBRIDRAFT_839921 [Obba rivulosa]
MHSSFFKLAALALLAAPGFAAPATAPHFEVLFSGPLAIGDLNVVSGPLGQRLNAPVLSGSLSDPAGNLVATIVPGTTADHGIIASDGTFYSDAKITLQWTADDKFAYIHALGVGEAGVHDLTYVYLETDSATWGSLNSRFLIADLTFGGVNDDPIFTVFDVL